MADYTINADQTGAYEIPLTAGVTKTVDIHNPSLLQSSMVRVSVHESTSPVYAKQGTTLTPKDPKAMMIPTGTWADINAANVGNITLCLVSSGAATVSVSRS